MRGGVVPGEKVGVDVWSEYGWLYDSNIRKEGWKEVKAGSVFRVERKGKKWTKLPEKNSKWVKPSRIAM